MAIAAALPVLASVAGGAGAGAAAGGGISIGSVIVPLLGGLALSAAARLFAPDPASEQSAAKTKETVGEIGPRSIIMGKVAVRGRCIHDNVYGPDKRQYQLVDLIADEEITGVSALILDGKRQTIQSNSQDGYRYSIDGYGSGASARYLFDWLPGTTTQSAFSAMVAHSEGGWTPAHRGRGCALAFSKLIYRPKEFPSRSPPARTYIAQGGKRWDFRLDSTMPGGSGSHRWSNPATWAYTRNPMVQLVHFLRGHWQNGKLWVGEGRAVDEIDFESFMASAAVCDQTVTNPDGTTRARYAIDLQCYGGGNQNIREVLDEVAKSTHGIWGERDGKLFFYVGYDRAAAITITDDDLDRGPGRVFDMSGKLDKEQGLCNEVSGTYVNADKRYQTKPVKTVRSTTAQTVDGRVLPLKVDFKAATNRWQARQIMLQLLEESRLTWNGQISVGPALALKLQLGDIILWSSARYNWVRRFRIERVERSFDGETGIFANLTLKETASTVWNNQQEDYDEGDGYEGEPQPALAAPQNLAATAVYETGAAGKKIAAAAVTWTPPADDTIDRIVFQVRRTGATRAYGSACDTPEDGTDTVRNGLGVDGGHQIRASFVRPAEGRATRAWSSWISITSDGDGGGPGDVIPPPRPTRASLNHGTSYSVEAKGRTKTVEVELRWGAVAASDFQDYTVRYRRVGRSTWRYLPGLADPRAEFEAPEGVAFEVQVQAFDQARNPSGWTPSIAEAKYVVTAAVDKDPPAAPRGATARGGHRRVNHRWTNAVDLDLRWVEVWGARYTGTAPASLAAAKAVLLEEVVGRSWVQDDLGLGEKWAFWYASLDTSGNRSVFYPPHTGPGISATTSRIDDDDLGERTPGQPGQPAAVQWESVYGADGALTVTAPLAWTAPAANTTYVPAASYEIEVTRGKQVSIIKVAGLTHAYVGVPQGVYSFRVRAVSRTGRPGTWSTARSATAPRDLQAPPAPQTPTAAGEIRSIVLEIPAVAATDFKRFDVRWQAAATPVPGSTAKAMAWTTDTRWVLPNLTPGTSLYFWVRSVDRSDNRSAWVRTAAPAVARRIAAGDVELNAIIGQETFRADTVVTGTLVVMEKTIARKAKTKLRLEFRCVGRPVAITPITYVTLAGPIVIKRNNVEVFRADFGMPTTADKSAKTVAGGKIDIDWTDETPQAADGNVTYKIERAWPDSAGINQRFCTFTHIMA